MMRGPSPRRAAVLAAVVIAGGVQKLHHGGYSLRQLLHLIGIAEADIQGQLHPAAPDGTPVTRRVPLTNCRMAD